MIKPTFEMIASIVLVVGAVVFKLLEKRTKKKNIENQAEEYRQNELEEKAAEYRRNVLGTEFVEDFPQEN